MITGKADVSHTYDYFESIGKAIQPINLNSTGWYASPGGIGTYRMHRENEEHREALRYALLNGINVIDTAINYMDGMSEELIGKILDELIAAGRLKREQIIVISKAGYIQGNLLGKIKERSPSYQHLLKFDEQMWYSLDPQFIRDMVEHSRQRMKLETIDVYLIHNPEYHLFYTMRQKGRDYDAAMEDFLFYQQLKRAFIALEEEVKKGSIQFYGVSSNTLPTMPQSEGHVSALKLLAVAHEAAEEVWGDGTNHHCRFLQFPFNLIESQAYLLPLDEYPEGPMTLFQFCRKYQLDILTNRPLNAVWKNSIIRLAKYPCSMESDAFHSVQKELDQLLETEQIFQQFLKEHHLDQLPVGNQTLNEYFSLYLVIKQHFTELQDFDMLNHFFYGFILPRLRYAYQIFEKALLPEFFYEGKKLFDQYSGRIQFLMDSIKQYVCQKMNKNVDPIERELKRFFLMKNPSYGLAGLSLLALISLPDMGVVLNGMRKVSYIKDFLQVSSGRDRWITPDEFRMLSGKIVKKLP